jgi:hypothetical protein
VEGKAEWAQCYKTFCVRNLRAFKKARVFVRDKLFQSILTNTSLVQKYVKYGRIKIYNIWPGREPKSFLAEFSTFAAPGSAKANGREPKTGLG